jgi:hypothetical protein
MLYQRLLAALLFLAAVPLALAQDAAVDGKQTLRWKFEPGTKWQVAFEQRSNVATLVAGKSTTQTLETGMEMLWEVESVAPSGEAVITQKFERFQIELELPNTGLISYDSGASGKPAGDARTLAAAVKPLMETEIKLTLSPRGTITAVEIQESTLSAVAGADASAAVKALFSKEGLTSILQQLAVELPEQAVAPGDTWSKQGSIATPLGALQQKTTYTLLPVDEKTPQLARIESTARFTLQPAAETTATVKEHEQLGRLAFDTEAGELRSTKVEQRLVTTATLKETKIEVRSMSTLTTTLNRK